MVDSVTLALEKVSIKDVKDNNDDSEVKILIDGRELRCSRTLLVQHSKYFKAYFDFQIQDGANDDNDNTVIIKGGLDYGSTKVILDALQDGIRLIRLDQDNVQSVLQASAFLQCQIAEQACADFILNNLSLGNAFSVFSLAVNCGATYLAEAAENYILDHVRTLRSKTTLDSVLDLLSMDLKALKLLLADIENNYVLYCTVCGWVAYDLDNRSEFLEDLLKDVIYEIVPADALLIDGLEDHPFVQDVIRGSDQYEKESLKAKLSYWQSVSETSRNLSKWPKFGIVVSTGNNNSLIAYRCSKSNRWLRLTAKPDKLKFKSSGSTVVVSSQSLFFLGGVGNIQMWRFDLKNDSWKCLSQDQEERIRPLVCGLGEDIFVFGGYSDRNKEVCYLDSAAKFNTFDNRWSLLSPMNNARSGGQACHSKGKIYLFGGLCSRRRVMVNCEVYDIKSDSYEHFTDLPAMILDFGLVLVGDSTVFLIGGMDPLTFETKPDVYIYDLESHQWRYDFPKLNTARKSCACFYDGRHLYVAGGATAELDQLSSVERFCPKKQKWERVDNLPKGLAASVTAVLADMPVRLMSNYRELSQSNVS